MNSLKYCEKKENLDGNNEYAKYYKYMSADFGEKNNYDTCSEQCDSIYNFLKDETKEKYTIETKSNNTKFSTQNIIDIVFLSLFIIFLIFFIFISFHF